MKELKYNLGAFVDSNGVLRCGGRLNNAKLTGNERNPILIPKNSQLSTVLISNAHEKVKHSSIKDTITELRSKFWIINCRKLVTNFISKCVTCRRVEGPHYKSQPSSQLPPFRVRRSFPFSNTGLDYIGSFLVRQIYDIDNDTQMHNVHVVLYTCAATRAVHLDLVPDTSASSFLRSLKRFIGRRGVPTLMISDNASCFKSEEVRLSEELLLLGIKWKFIVACAPSWGGFWERLVRTVKRSLFKILQRASVTYEELLTVVAEIEGIMNSRPLTYINSDLEEALTPGHLLMGKRIIEPNIDNTEEPGEENLEEQVKLSKRMKYLKLLSDHYWSRWKNEYLLELRNSHSKGDDTDPCVEVGQVVIVHDKLKRNRWRLGVIVRLLKGTDGKVRAVVLKTCI